MTLGTPLTTRLVDNDELALQALFRRENWTDGLPVIIPTRDRVEDFLGESGLLPRRFEALGPMRPSGKVGTVEMIAVNALMAGCEPVHLGVVLAAIEAMLRPEWNVGMVSVATNPSGPFVIVNGPLGAAIGLRSGAGALGPGQSPNGPIGRAVRLVMRNVGGAIEGVDVSALAQPLRYACCMAEAEDISPWEPYHASVGFAPEDDVVTVTATETLIGLLPVRDQSKPFGPQFVKQVAQAMQAVGSNRFFSSGSPAFIVDPGHAQLLANEGYDRRRLRDELFEAGKIPVELMESGNLRSGKWKIEDGKISIADKPEDLVIIVGGDAGGIHSTYMQGFCHNVAQSARVWKPSSSGPS